MPHYARREPQGQALAHAWVHEEPFADDRYCVLAWGAYDYVSGTGNRRWGVKFIGVVDLFRVTKLGAAIYQAQIDPHRRPATRAARPYGAYLHRNCTDRARKTGPRDPAT